MKKKICEKEQNRSIKERIKRIQQAREKEQINYHHKVPVSFLNNDSIL